MSFRIRDFPPIFKIGSFFFILELRGTYNHLLSKSYGQNRFVKEIALDLFQTFTFVNLVKVEKMCMLNYVVINVKKSFTLHAVSVVIFLIFLKNLVQCT